MNNFIKVILVLVVIGFVSGLAYFLLGSDSEDFFVVGEPSAEEKALLLTPEDLVDYFSDFTPVVDATRFSKFKIFKTQTIDAVYEVSENNQPNMNCSIKTFATDFNARQTFFSDLKGMELGFKVGARNTVELEEMDGLTFGELSKFYLLDSERGPVGNLFSIKRDKGFYSCFLIGFYIDESEVLKEVITPKIERFLSYDFHQ